MRFKKPKSHHRHGRRLGDAGLYGEYLKDNVLTCYKVDRHLPKKGLLDVLFMLEKANMLANGASFAKADDTHYAFLIGSLDERSAETLRQNLLNSSPEFWGAARAEVPATRAEGFLPSGQVVPKDVYIELSTRLSEDPDIIEFMNHGIAQRMDQSPGGEFLFPDLSQEEYEEIKRARERKPS